MSLKQLAMPLIILTAMLSLIIIVLQIESILVTTRIIPLTAILLVSSSILLLGLIYSEEGQTS